MEVAVIIVIIIAGITLAQRILVLLKNKVATFLLENNPKTSRVLLSLQFQICFIKDKTKKHTKSGMLFS